MTNGEKFKEVFGISQVDEGELYAYAWLPNHDAAEISIEWWNAEYKDPTTKNDLGVDCISRADLYNRIKKIDHDEDYECDEFGGSKITYHTCDWDEVLREIEDAPSVTPQEPCENNICDSCHTKGCIFQSGIKRVNCEFYTAQNEPCNDAISRESLLNKLCGYHVDIEKSIFDKLWRVIKDMPSVTPQEPKSEWEYDHAILKAYSDGANEVLDKLKAEIKQHQSDYDIHGTEYDRTAWKAFNRCLQIINKYGG